MKLIRKLTKLSKKLICTLMAMFVISIEVISFGASDTDYYIRPVGKWTFGASSDTGGYVENIGIGMGLAGAIGLDFYDGSGTKIDPMDYARYDTDFLPNFNVGFFYNGQLIISKMVTGKVGSDFGYGLVNMNIVGDEGPVYPNASDNDALRAYLTALKSDPNTKLEMKVIPYLYYDAAGNEMNEGYDDSMGFSGAGVPTPINVPLQDPTSGTWLQVLTGFDDPDKALAWLNSLDGTSGDIKPSDIYGDYETYGFFQSLSNAIADMIYGLANLLYNIVQDGLKEAGSTTSKLITIDDLVFDRYSEININFWEAQKGGTSLISQIRDFVSEWYNKFRGIAIVLYMITLLYVGVRILLAVGGRQQERYKEMLTYWLSGIVILFFFPLAVKYSIIINHAIVEEIGKKNPTRIVNGSIDFTYPQSAEDTEDAQLTAQAVTSSPFTMSSVGSDYMAAMSNSYESDKTIPKAFVYFIMVIQFIMILITYYKRLFMTAFLFVIFPFVAYTFVLDKMGDGSAQAFQTWTKEIMLNIFMQSIHAVIYVFAMSVMFTGTTYNGDWILAIVGVSFLFKGEEILRAMLGQQGGETAKSIRDTATKVATSIAVTQAVADRLTSGASKASGVVRAERQARADRKTARALRGEETTFRGRFRNMKEEFKKGRDDNNWETHLGFAKRVLNARNAQTRSGTWAQAMVPTSGGQNISLSSPPQTNEGREMLEAARIVSDPIGEGADPEKLAQAYDIIKKYEGSQNPEVQEIKSKLGVSDEQLRDIAEAQASAAKKLVGANTEDPEKYKETLTKVNKELEIRLSTILTGSKNNFDSQEVIMWKRAVLSDLKNISTSQIYAGLTGGEEFLTAGSKSLNKEMSAEAKKDEFIDRAKDLQAFVDVSDREKIARGGYFALDVARSRVGTSNRTELTSRARQEKADIRKRFEPDREKRDQMRSSPHPLSGMLRRKTNDASIQRSLRGRSDRYLDELAEDIAVLKDFGSRTHLSYDQQISNESVSGYTMEEIKDRILRLQQKVKNNESINSIVQQELGFNVDEVDEITDNLILMAYPDSGQSSVVNEYLDNKQAVENISDSVKRDAQRLSGNTIQKQIAAKKSEAMIRKIRKKVLERKERDILVSVRPVGFSGSSSGNANNGSVASSQMTNGVRVTSSGINSNNPQDILVNIHADVDSGSNSSAGGNNPGTAAPQINNGVQVTASSIDNGNPQNPIVNIQTGSNTGNAGGTGAAAGPRTDPTLDRMLNGNNNSVPMDNRQQTVAQQRVAQMNQQSSNQNASQNSDLQEVLHRHYRPSAGGKMAVDGLFELLAENPDLDYRELAAGGDNKSMRYAGVIGQLQAGDNREKISGLVDDLLQATKERDENLMADRLFGMTAQEYEDRAKANKKKAFEDALGIATGTAGAALFGTAAGFMNIGMSSSDSMLKEFGAGFATGAVAAAGAASIATGGVGKKTIKVENPYDGTITEVSMDRFGAFFEGQVGPFSIKEGEILSFNDPRLDKVRTSISAQLVDAAVNNRKERQNKAAKEKASRFQEALNYRENKKS